MRYDNVIKGTFLDRPNRFTADVLINEESETVHVKNTGRCRELLVPGAEVWLTKSENLSRKTAYDLIAVRKESGLLVNIDSQAPNKFTDSPCPSQQFGRMSQSGHCMAFFKRQHARIPDGDAIWRKGIGIVIMLFVNLDHVFDLIQQEREIIQFRYPTLRSVLNNHRFDRFSAACWQ